MSLIRRMAETHEYLVTLEDSSIAGGAGSAVLEYVNQQQLGVALLRLGLSDMFPDHGSRDEVLEEYGLDQESISRSIVEFTRN